MESTAYMLCNLIFKHTLYVKQVAKLPHCLYQFSQKIAGYVIFWSFDSFLNILLLLHYKISFLFQRILSTNSKSSKEENRESWNSVNTRNQEKVSLHHIDIDTREKDTGFTPLSLAVLNGNILSLCSFFFCKMV